MLAPRDGSSRLAFGTLATVPTSRPQESRIPLQDIPPGASNTPPPPTPQVSQALIRSFSSTARNRFKNRVPEKQKLFQEENDIPLYLKGGVVDNILYRVTMGLCLGGTAYGLYCLGWASFPRNK
ncbi:Cytochrome c oxidase subunit 7A1, mitochondrial [Saguinus oedipus]|uniref:Cytochrome c oxidase subunit 7A1, mitochondrial n=1 Tax=Saguinus oedipus TaxID=9490 RepID=A0ABQ9TUL0_SAGOE|nr:Cytochrome c oxidase subunit 7A1, mitochondrial [Saguinus oedipus]